MTKTHDPAFALRCTDDEACPPVLAGVEALGRLEGVLFTLTLRQTYRNTGDHNLEIVYSFPLPVQAVLLGFAAVFGDHRLEGVVMPRATAEAVYEEALAEGDAPVLLEVTQGGLHTASVGNLQPGESVVLETRFAQLLGFEQGRLRLAIPTTIAPRYGDAARGGLQPHQVPAVSLSAEYPLCLAVTVAGSLAAGAIECPTHAHRLERGTDGVQLILAEGAALDRDVVLVVTPGGPRPDLLATAEDGAGNVVKLAAFEVPPAPLRECIALGLVVDCSGSMGGDSIASARAALHGVVDGLGPQDEVSLSRFGNTVEHVLAPSPCASAVSSQLRRLIDATQASMGGTEMERALRSVFRAWPAAGGADVLLITDGEVWDVDAVVEAARRGGHRVFAIGVGSAPAENVLRQLAEATGGACEFATPGEGLQAAARRMLTRIRQQAFEQPRVEWGAALAWQVAPPQRVFGGDTLLAFAGFEAGQVPSHAVRLLAGPDDDRISELARVQATVPCPGTDLARIAAARRLPELDRAAAMQSALDHQLLTDQTHCVLVHRRTEEDKPAREAQLHRVSSMLAAGWGATGSVLPLVLCHRDPSYSLAEPSVWRSASKAGDWLDALNSATDDEIEIPAFLRKQDAQRRSMSLDDIAQGVARYVRSGGDLAGLPAHCRQWLLPDSVRRVVGDLVAQGLEETQAWLLLADWIGHRLGPDRESNVQAILSPLVKTVDRVQKDRAWKAMECGLAWSTGDSWNSARVRRLRRALQP